MISRTKLQDMMYISLFAAVVAALGIIPGITTPLNPTVPITLQTLGVMLAGGILGAKRGSLSLVIFVLLVAIGAPVLSGGRGGLSILAGPSGGYILSWPFAAFLIGYLVERNWQSLNYMKVLAFNIVGGIILVYAVGIPFLAAVTELTLNVAATSSLVYIPGDLIKALIAASVVIAIKKSKPLIRTKKSDSFAA